MLYRRSFNAATVRSYWVRCCLMASLMNVALVADQLQTKYLNYLFEVGRGSYANLPELILGAVAIGFIVPVAGILAFGSIRPPRRLNAPRDAFRN